MKNYRFSLGLFSEGGESGVSSPASGDCDAQQSTLTADSPADLPPALSDAERIANELGLGGKSADELISLIRSEKDRRQLLSILQEKKAAREYEKLFSEARSLASRFNGFDIREELRNSRFSAMLRAGLSVEDAFRAAHFEGLLRAAVENAKNEAAADAVMKMRLNSSRPDENGSSSSSPVSTRTGVDSLTGRGIRDILRRVEKGAKVKF